MFERPSCSVKTILCERTFWEKATILHQIAFMDDEKKLPPRHSRHYYDLYMMVGTHNEKTALEDFELLADVAAFKSRFYRSPRARYDLAKPATLKLIPTENRRATLEEDYSRMREMIFGDVPEFHEVMHTLSDLESKIHNESP